MSDVIFVLLWFALGEKAAFLALNMQTVVVGLHSDVLAPQRPTAGEPTSTECTCGDLALASECRA